jgi:hypothetical protein
MRLLIRIWSPSTIMDAIHHYPVMWSNSNVPMGMYYMVTIMWHAYLTAAGHLSLTVSVSWLWLIYMTSLVLDSACYNICPPAPVPDNGRLVSISNNSYRMYGGISEGTVALYMCQRGFYLHGSVVRRCMHYGEWNGETTMCLQGKLVLS